MQTHDKYTLSERLGVGPHSDVYLAKETAGLGRKVAMKRLRDNVLSQPKRRDSFFTAAERWSSVKHDHLVTLFDLDRSAGAVIYEAHPTTAALRLSGGASYAPAMTEQIKQVFSGLHHLHTNNFLHLNLKPTNLLIDANDRIKLIDGHCLDRNRLGELPLPTGGQKYLAPEMINSSVGTISAGADIYCLGFVLLEMLVGPSFDQMFRISAGDAAEKDRNWLRWHADLEQKLPPLREHIPSLSSPLCQVFERALNKDPLQRYHSAAELLSELETTQAETQPSEASASQPAAAREPSSASASGRPSPSPSSPVAKPTTAATANPTTPAADAPKINDIPARPAAPVVLRFFGTDTDMVGLNTDYFTLGDREGCDVAIPPAMGGTGDSQLSLSRGAEGWRVLAADNLLFYVNQEPSRGVTPLRSGDIVRLAPAAPGVQFTILHQDVDSLAKLAARYAPRLVKQADGDSNRAATPAPPRRAGDAAPPSPQRFAPAASAATNPGEAVSASATAKATAKATESGRGPAPPRRPAKPSKPEKAGKQPKPPKAAKPPKAVANGSAADAGPGIFARLKAMTDTSDWDPNKKNWAMLIISLVTMAIVIGFWPSEEEPPTEENATQEISTDSAPETPPVIEPIATSAETADETVNDETTAEETTTDETPPN